MSTVRLHARAGPVLAVDPDRLDGEQLPPDGGEKKLFNLVFPKPELYEYFSRYRRKRLVEEIEFEKLGDDRKKQLAKLLGLFKGEYAFLDFQVRGLIVAGFALRALINVLRARSSIRNDSSTGVGDLGSSKDWRAPRVCNL